MSTLQSGRTAPHVAAAAAAPSKIHLCGRTLLIGPGVFTPQPESIDLVAWLAAHPDAERWTRAADLCAGAGTLAVLLAHQLPALEIDAVERSYEAMPYLAANVDRFDGRVRARLEDVRACLPQERGTFDLVIANPPHIPTHELHLLTADANGADPMLAVHGGHSGLDGVELVARAAARLLRPGGLLAIEHSATQGPEVTDMLRRFGWLGISDHNDSFRRPRFVTATVPPSMATR